MNYLFQNQMAGIWTLFMSDHSSDMNKVVFPFIHKKRVGVGMQPLKAYK